MEFPKMLNNSFKLDSVILRKQELPVPQGSHKNTYYVILNDCYDMFSPQTVAV